MHLTTKQGVFKYFFRRGSKALNPNKYPCWKSYGKKACSGISYVNGPWVPNQIKWKK